MKISFVAQIKVARLSSKEKALVHDRGRNFDLIISKLDKNVGFIMIQIEFIDELCGANRSGNTFLQIKYYNPLYRSRNFVPIISKFGTKVGLV